MSHLYGSDYERKYDAHSRGTTRSSSAPSRPRDSSKKSSKRSSKARKRRVSLSTAPVPTRKQRGRRPGKYGGSRSSLSRKKLISILAQEDIVTYVDWREVLPAQSGTASQYSVYFTSTCLTNKTGSLVVTNDTPQGSTNVFVMQEIANQISATYQDIVFEQTHFDIRHEITSRVSQEIYVEGWLCEARDHINNNVYPFQLQAKTMQDILGWAYFNQSQSGGNNDKTNTLYANVENTPYVMNPFLQYYKIVKHKRHKLSPGKTCAYSIKDTKLHLIRPQKYVANVSGTIAGTFYGAIPLHYHVRGERFWLFRTYSAQVGVLTGVSTTIQDPGASVIMKSMRTYKYKFVQDNRTTIASFASGITANSSTTDIIQVETGAKTTTTIA